ncbi:DUF2202 domain-containing protein [Algoriphagus sp.]|uniref:DUF2202 domain-containing protein n=1 Tax=Algoriphagus sp. TaxID=1872435 RepID=UPI0025FFE462|nr:DUF2202 domain-containing protein [Algoriphagus sp.]
MKKLIGFFLILVSISSCQEDEKPLQIAILNEGDQKTLLYMREEEKLAHDIYINAFDKYGILAFQNIANSETKHIQAVLNMMNRYQVTDPLNGSTKIGEFTIPEIKELYLQLLTKVNESNSQALLVGLLIEDLDIYDLENAISETNNNSLILLYENLKCGSMNHLRSFEDLASLSNLTYSPIYISQSEYDSILDSPRTSCNN